MTRTCRFLLAVLVQAGLHMHQAASFQLPAPKIISLSAVSVSSSRRIGFTSSLYADQAADSDVTADEEVDMLEEFEEYSRCLSPREERRQIRKEDKEYAIVDERPKWQQAIQYPFKAASKVVYMPKGRGVQKPGALILLRCGESEWNVNQTFTGWADPDLTEQGLRECEHAGRLLLAEGYQPDLIYTSRLKRAVRSVWTMLTETDDHYLPVYKSWRLNERHYGALQGLSKKGAAEQLGAKTVQAWRNSLKARPPAIKKSDPHYPGNDRKYSDLTEDQLPLTESLLDCQERARPLWEYKIRSDIERGNNVLVVAHTNTLRGLIKVIDDVSDKDIQEVSMPNGVPFVYRFDKKMKTKKPKEGYLTQEHTNGSFLEKPGLLKEALKRQRDWERLVPGFDSAEIEQEIQRETTLEKALDRLRKEQEMEAWAEKFVDDKAAADEGTDGELKLVNGAPSIANGDTPTWNDDPYAFEEYDSDFTEEKEEKVPVNVLKAPEKEEEQKDPVVVFIRHGRTPHNNLGLFTGWEDPPLADDGVEDAKRAGRLLKKHGYQFDVAYSSWLTRAITTAWYVMDELDCLWLPIVKSWRLNERMYGALTGKSKKMVANEYGEDQLIKWRRGYKIRPPAVSSFSFSYPGNDYRRTKHVKDLRISWSETFARSLEDRKFQFHRKFPKHESLRDCMDRSIPFYTERICQEAVNKGKRVLITSHENAIRGILMHLCDIPPEAMNQLHLPNGLPLVYNVKGKCITLLADDSGEDPMDQHDFGPAAKYLFKPCELDDDFFEQMAKKEVSPKEKVAA